MRASIADTAVAPSASVEDDHIVSRLSRQLCAGLLRRHVGGVPIRPIGIAHSGSFLVLSMRRFRATERAHQIGYRTERSHSRIDSSGKPRRNLLQQPTIAVGITEGGERPVRTVFRIWTTNRTIRTQVEDLTHLNLGGNDRLSGCFDV